MTTSLMVGVQCTKALGGIRLASTMETLSRAIRLVADSSLAASTFFGRAAAHSY